MLKRGEEEKDRRSIIAMPNESRRVSMLCPYKSVPNHDCETSMDPFKIETAESMYV